MSLHEKLSKLEGLSTHWQQLRRRGLLLMSTGAILAFASVADPKLTVMHGDDFSLLPLCGIVIMTIGLLECFDAYIAKESKDFLFNLQTGLLDVVVAFLIIFSLGDNPSRLSSLIAAFLITN